MSLILFIKDNSLINYINRTCNPKGSSDNKRIMLYSYTQAFIWYFNSNPDYKYISQYPSNQLSCHESTQQALIHRIKILTFEIKASK